MALGLAPTGPQGVDMTGVAPHTPAPVGFIGLGHMGEPMAGRLASHGVDLVVWNRTRAAAERLAGLGARPAESPREVFAACRVVVLMLADGTAADAVLGRRDGRFDVDVAGRVVVNMGTVSPEYSRGLHDDVRAAGGRFVEAPVSGSRVPAETGTLVAMLAGDDAAADVVEPLLEPLTAATFRCGDVPRALETKLAVNVFLISLVVGLTEAVHFAESHGIDLPLLQAVLDAGPMASAVSRGKLAKLAAGDLSAQAAVRDVHYNNRLILAAAAQRGTPVPLLTRTAELLAEAERLGRGGEDMVAVIEALRSRSSRDADVSP